MAEGKPKAEDGYLFINEVNTSAETRKCSSIKCWLNSSFKNDTFLSLPTHNFFLYTFLLKIHIMMCGLHSSLCLFVGQDFVFSSQFPPPPIKFPLSK
jgi:hypothetical protein